MKNEMRSAMFVVFNAAVLSAGCSAGHGTGARHAHGGSQHDAGPPQEWMRVVHNDPHVILPHALGLGSTSDRVEVNRDGDWETVATYQSVVVVPLGAARAVLEITDGQDQGPSLIVLRQDGSTTALEECRLWVPDPSDTDGGVLDSGGWFVSPDHNSVSCLSCADPGCTQQVSARYDAEGELVEKATLSMPLAEKCGSPRDLWVFIGGVPHGEHGVRWCLACRGGQAGPPYVTTDEESNVAVSDVDCSSDVFDYESALAPPKR